MLRFSVLELLTTATKGFFHNCFFVEDVRAMKNIAIVSAILSVYYAESEIRTYISNGLSTVIRQKKTQNKLIYLCFH